jgi:hypothetical protein
VAIVASCALGGRAAALDLGNEGLGRSDTVAYQDGLKKWDNAKRFGAERVVDRDRTLFQPDGVRSGKHGTRRPRCCSTTIYATNANRVSDVRLGVVPGAGKVDLPRHVPSFAVGASSRICPRVNADFAMMALHFDHAHTLALSVLSALRSRGSGGPDAPETPRRPRCPQSRPSD